MTLGWSNTASRPGPDNSNPYKMLKKQNVQINEKTKMKILIIVLKRFKQIH